MPPEKCRFYSSPILVHAARVFYMILTESITLDEQCHEFKRLSQSQVPEKEIEVERENISRAYTTAHDTKTVVIRLVQ